MVAGVELRSRLFLGTGKYRSDEDMLGALEASGCELVTVALRRLDLDDPARKTILDVIGRPPDDQLRIEALNAYSSPDPAETRALLQRFYDKPDAGRAGRHATELT